MTRWQARAAVPVLLAAVAAGSAGCTATPTAGTTRTPAPAVKEEATAKGSTSPKADATGTAGTGAAAASPAPASVAAVLKADKWLAGPSEKLLGTVNTSVVEVSRDVLSGRHGTAVADAGRRLAAAAKAALDGPRPPLDAALYRAALADLRDAGTDAASGHLGAVEPLLIAGTSEIAKVTAAADLVAPAGEPPGAGDPS